MRHSASMITAMEGINKAVYSIARELSQNSRSGLTVRFLSKKLELPQEEIEYLVDVNHNLLFTDLTKIKLPAEGLQAVKRVHEGLENLGDVPSIYRRLRGMASFDFRRLEEHLDVSHLGTKKAVAEHLVEHVYRHPDSVVEYVATSGFSATAREVFDIVWQSKDGVMPIPKIRAAHGGTEFEVENALWELFRGLALFEMFRFDAEDRLVRMGGVLSEIRQYRENSTKQKRRGGSLKSKRGIERRESPRELAFTDTICQLVAALAAKPARLRGDGELFREDLRRLSAIVDEEAEPSLATCLWAAEGVGWLARVDNELRAGELEDLIDVLSFDRHARLFDWILSTGNERLSRSLMMQCLDEIKVNAWYSVTDFLQHAMHIHEAENQSVLKSRGAHYAYVSPGSATNADKVLARSLEESLYWLGAVERSSDGLDNYFALTDLGLALLSGESHDAMRALHAKMSREIIVQPNFDIVVPTQDMDPLLTVPLDQFALRQSTGQATVYLLNKDTFTQGLQEGHDGDAFIDFLMAHNRGGTLPTNVMTTLEDWRGGLKRVRLRTIQIVETDDPLVMADLQHRRTLKKFLRPLDTKKVAVYQKAMKQDFVKQLEKDGYIID